MPRSLSFALLVLLLVLPSPAPAQQAPKYAGVDHVALDVVDLGRALVFHTRLFGTELWERPGDEHRYLRLGSAWLALAQSGEARPEHVALGVDDFEPGAAGRWYDLQELRWQAAGDSGLQVADADDNRLLLFPHGELASLLQPVAEQPSAVPPVFRPLGIDEIFITVGNLEVDGLFYARLLEQTGTLQAGSLWFTLGNGARLRLGQSPVGQLPGLNYFAILVSNTDLEAAAEAVFSAGGIIETILPNGFSFWDPDGHRIVVRTTGMF